VSVDQTPIRGSRRSNPATYSGLLDPIRKAFAKANGVKPALFSANSEGACPNCNGAGVIYTDLAMMAGVATTCEECEGKRFQASVLEYHLGGRDISELLAMSVTEAEEFFGAGEARTPAAHAILNRLADVALEIAILGSVEPRMDGGVVGVPAGKQRALLTLLAVHAPHPVSAEHAAEALWPRAAPAEALRSLQVTVSRLRRSLGAAGSALETAASGYRLAVAADAIDARRFETLRTEAQEARVEGDARTARRLLDDALGLWRGPALADAGYESFAQTEIARLEELRLAALEERIDARLSQGEHALVVAELEQLSAEHPSRERLVGLLMLALYRCGRQSDALEVCTRGRLRLDEELGLEPSPELKRLQEAILRHDASLEVPGDGGRGARRGSIDHGQPPEGVVTMLFTDIDGSTRLARAAGSLWPQLLAEHHGLVSDAVVRAGGHVDARATRCSRTSSTRPARSRPRSPRSRRCAATRGRNRSARFACGWASTRDLSVAPRRATAAWRCIGWRA
jgi:DNA-binding SARP family transcriptional activator